ncbi:glycosyltransferase family 4 protein [Vicingus serpentipes]|uniref:Glycosyltransferase family 4 protein n=1 Tax=Vicingus serpentipes TaxID=1926625 RepID=A0A5C6RN12_9FLAO|nr:glycosyltransferase [Vicingus serpentipes]TXB63706.1 glycosyltransferase family 4 protein [Vicingus serpentipes]
MKVNIISINPITVIPVLRYIVHHFIDKMNADVTLTETHVKSFNSYYNKIAHFKFDNIAEYETYQEFRKQSAGFKLSKYLFIVKKIWHILNSNEQQIIYTSDYQVLFFILKLQAFFKTKKQLIIYHQYELIELTKLNKINHFLYTTVLKKAKEIDLMVFSENNRLNYFLKNSSLKKENAFVLPNSCESISSNEKHIKHPLFNQFPSNSFIVTHLGNVGGEQHYFSNFINAVEKLQENKEIVFLFIGRKNELIKKIEKEKQFANLYFVDAVPHEELNQIYPFINLGVILYKGNGLNYEFCAPNKLYELWANGVPVIAHQLKGLIPLFKSKNRGVLSNFNQVDQICETLLNYAKNNSTINKQILIDEFNNELAISTYLEQFEQKITLLLKQ